MSKKYHKIKPWQGLKIFKNIKQELETVKSGGHDLWKSQYR